MSSQQITPSGAHPASTNVPKVQEIHLEWDAETGAVTVTPPQVPKGTTVVFKNPKGGKVRIVFLSPDGAETDSVLDSKTYNLSIGGAYHFECFFTPLGATQEIKAKTGGVIDVTPQRP
jgi:hypothetical protein